MGPSIGFRYENDFFTNDPEVVKNEFLVRTGLWISETFNVEIANSGTDEHRTASGLKLFYRETTLLKE